MCSADLFCVADLTGPEIIKDPARLADEANALSLTGGARLEIGRASRRERV